MIKIITFGHFDILHDGNSILNSVFNSKKCVQILLFLIVNKNASFKLDALVKHIWPNNDYSDATQVLRTYLHRLNKTLEGNNSISLDLSGYFQIVNVKKMYMIKISDDVKLDTGQFEGLRNAILDDTKNAVNVKSMLASYNRLLEVYSGHFLNHIEDEPWVIPLRNGYIKSLCSCLQSIIAVLELGSKYDEIILVCEAGFKKYDLDEKINISFINALYETNQINYALQHYGFITEKMYKELAEKPSQQMKKLYSKIRTIEKSTKEVQLARRQSDTIINEKKPEYDKIMTLVDSLVKDYKEAYLQSFTVVLIELEGEGIKGYTLHDIFESALRSNDIYTVFNEKTGIAVIANAKEEYYDAIKERFEINFYKIPQNKEITFSILISSLN